MILTKLPVALRSLLLSCFLCVPIPCPAAQVAQAARLDMRGNLAILDVENTPICGAVLLSPTIVLTAAHCARAGAAVQCNGAFIPVEISNYDQDEDLATLDLLTACKAPLASFAKTNPAVGTEVYAMGYPEYQPRMSRGIVSGYESIAVPVAGSTPRVFLSTDVAGMGGSSGGGLFNAAGELVGIASLRGGAFMFYSPVSRITRLLAAE